MVHLHPRDALRCFLLTEDTGYFTTDGGAQWQPVLQIRVKQDEIARYGIPAQSVMNLVRSLGSNYVGEVYEGQLRFPLVIRLPEAARANPEAIGQILVATPAGQRVPLSRLASIERVEGFNTIKRDWYQRRITIEANVRGRDLGTFVAEAQRRIEEEVKLPPGRYHLEWGGQFENLERAQRRLLFVVPIALFLVFSLGHRGLFKHCLISFVIMEV